MASAVEENDTEVLNAGETNESAIEKETGDKQMKILNGLPMLYKDQVFDKRFEIFERIGWDDKVGASYFGYDQLEKKEVVIRIDRNDNRASVVKMEAVFLNAAEKNNLWVHFEQVLSQALVGPFCYVAIYHRDGPSLADCHNYAKDHQFSHGTAARLAYDVFKIVEATHKLGYLLRSMHPSLFYLDVNNRHLFLFDRSTIQIDANNLGLPPENNRWVGGPQYAPRSYHRGGPLRKGDELESLFYLLVEMVTGSLPWESARAEHIGDLKDKCIENGVLLVGLPREYGRLQDEIMQLGSEIDYEHIGNLIKEIIEQVGGVHDHETNFDFERDPNEDDLPKFVLERDDVPQSAVEEDLSTAVEKLSNAEVDGWMSEEYTAREYESDSDQTDKMADISNESTQASADEHDDIPIM